MQQVRGTVDWVDVLNDGTVDLAPLGQQFHLHPVIMRELATPSARARVESYGSYLYLVYQFPVYDEREQVSRRTEIDFVITPTHVLTVRYEDLPVFEHFRAALADPDVRAKATENTLQFTYHLIEAILGFNQRQLHHIGEKLETIAAQLFQDREKEVLELVSYVKRDLSEYRLIFHPQGELLRSLVENGEVFWGQVSRPYLTGLVGDHLKLVNQLEGYRGALADYDATNNQLMNVKATEVMKTFSVLAFLTFPSMLVVAFFTTHLQGIPFRGHPHGFWILLGLVAAATVAMLVYFKSKRWL